MTKRTNLSLFRTRDGLEGLRKVAIFLRDDRGLSRAEICKLANVSPTDFDNFTLQDPRSKVRKYKSTVPREEFQIALYQFALANEREQLHLADGNRDIATLYRTLKSEWTGPNHPVTNSGQFDYLLRAHALQSEGDIHKLLGRLAGNYFCYRLSSHGNKVIKGHISIPPFDLYTKVPTFVHRRLDDDNRGLIVSRGTILEINDRYVFNGFVYGSPDEAASVIGIKQIVINKGSKEHVFDGIYLCSDLSGYEFGRIKVKQTDEKFDEGKIFTKFYVDQDDIDYRHLFLSPKNWKASITEVRSAIVCSFESNNDEQAQHEPRAALTGNWMESHALPPRKSGELETKSIP